MENITHMIIPRMHWASKFPSNLGEVEAKLSTLIEQIKKISNEARKISRIDKLCSLDLEPIRRKLREFLGVANLSVEKEELINNLLKNLIEIKNSHDWKKILRENDEFFRKLQKEDLLRVQTEIQELLESQRKLIEELSKALKEIIEKLKEEIKVLWQSLTIVESNIRTVEGDIGELKQKLVAIDTEIQEDVVEVKDAVQDIRKLDVQNLLFPEDKAVFDDCLGKAQQFSVPREVQAFKSVRDMLDGLFVGLTKVTERLAEEIAIVENLRVEKETRFNNAKHELEENIIKRESIDKSIALGKDTDGHLQKDRNDLDSLIERQKSLGESIKREIQEDGDKLTEMTQHISSVNKIIAKLNKTQKGLDEKCTEREKIEKELQEKKTQLVKLKDEHVKLEKNIRKHEELLKVVQNHPVDTLDEKTVNKLEVEAENQEISIQMKPKSPGF